MVKKSERDRETIREDHARRRPRGAALATVLMVVVLAVILVFVAAGTSIFHLNVVTRVDNETEARNKAESIIAQCIDSVITTQSFGTLRTETLDIPPDANKATAVLTFDPVYAEKHHIPYSTNNSAQSFAVAGWNNTVVPGYGLHLVGIGSSSDVTRRIEAIVHAPPFNFCVASSGKFLSRGKLLVGTVERASDIYSGIDITKLLPGHLLSNSPEEDAVSLKSEGTITGDLRTTGNIMIESNKMKVCGELRIHQDPCTIPHLDITGYDPERKLPAVPVSYLTSPFVANPSLQGSWKVQIPQDTLYVNGNLKLNGGLLYVNGNLVVQKCIVGNGAVITTGKTTMGEGATLSSDNQVALVSGGDVKLGGSGSSSSSYFQGVVYTEGNFSAQEITVVGSFMSRKPDLGPLTNNVTLDNTTMIQVPPQGLTPLPPDGTFRMSGLIDAALNGMPPPSNSIQLESGLTGDPNVQKKCKLVQQSANQYAFELWEDEAGTRKTYISFDSPLNFIKGVKKSGATPFWKGWFNESDTDAFAKVARFTTRYLQGPAAPPEPFSGIVLDLNQFFNFKDRAHIVLWREI
jgi:hypothetical protein